MNKSLLSLAVLVVTAGSYASTVFFGWDDNPNGVVPLLDRPNHDAAKAQYLSALGSVGTLDFESIPDGPIHGLVSFGSETEALWTSSGGSNVTESQVKSTSEYEAYAFSGRKYYMVQSDPGTIALTITFAKTLRSVGLSFSDEADWFGIGNNPGHIIDFGYGEKFDMWHGLDTSKIHTGSAFFMGIIADQPFASMTITYSSKGSGTGTSADAVGIDDMMVSTVPEPGSLAAIGFGLALVGLRRRR